MAEQNPVWLPLPHVGFVSRLVICTPLAKLVNVIVKSSMATLPFHVSKPRPTPGVPQLNVESWLMIQPSPGAIVPLAPEPLNGITMVAPAITADATITAKILPKKRIVPSTSAVAVCRLRMSCQLMVMAQFIAALGVTQPEGRYRIFGQWKQLTTS